ncbi:MAG: hypothetical protein KAS32_10200 [Candidatus Peribacteraceae bacterium]|nr:hypothetical protein [Candidatus Peribacteraceae bacterium]
MASMTKEEIRRNKKLDILQVKAFKMFYRLEMEGKTDTSGNRVEAFVNAISKSSDSVFKKAKLMNPKLVEGFIKDIEKEQQE